MDRDLRERFQRLIERLQNQEWSTRVDALWVEDEVSRWLRHLERWLAEGNRGPISREFGRSEWDRLRHVEEKIDSLLNRPIRCNLPREVGQQLPNFMTTLTVINDGNLAIARSKFRSHQAAWLVEANRCIVCDPYIFHPGTEDATNYAVGLAEIIGAVARRIDFYFSAAPKRYNASVAALVVGQLQANYQGPPGTRQLTFYDCRDMHDRVWLRHSSTDDNPPYNEWEARVVGASVNGVRKRPTYVVDMENDDANDYARYLKNVRNILEPGAITLMPPP